MRPAACAASNVGTFWIQGGPVELPGHLFEIGSVDLICLRELASGQQGGAEVVPLGLESVGVVVRCGRRDGIWAFSGDQGKCAAGGNPGISAALALCMEIDVNLRRVGANRGCRDGRRMDKAFDILAAEYRPMVLAYLEALVADPHLAEDLTQESLMAAHRSIEKFDPERSFGAWLRGIARHKALEDRRALARRPVLVDSAVVEGMEEVYTLFDHSTGPWESRIQRVHRCIERLSYTLREAVAEVYGKGKTVKQAAASMGVRFAAVAQRLSRARQLIRACVEGAIQSTEQHEQKREEEVSEHV